MGDLVDEGSHKLEIFASDIAGHNTTETFYFDVDTNSPEFVVKSPLSGMTVSDRLPINFEVLDENLPENGAIGIILPDGELIKDETSFLFNSSQLEDGQYEIQLFATDKAQNQRNQNNFILCRPQYH